ncbi:hypothetical protein [Aquimarina longa]|nr:hypothetical protein [Aquimarina longa]
MYEDEDDIDDFPMTFDNSKEFHSYNSIEDITGDNYLFIHNVSIVFE